MDSPDDALDKLKQTYEQFFKTLLQDDAGDDEKPVRAPRRPTPPRGRNSSMPQPTSRTGLPASVAALTKNDTFGRSRYGTTWSYRSATNSYDSSPPAPFIRPLIHRYLGTAERKVRGGSLHRAARAGQLPLKNSSRAATTASG